MGGSWLALLASMGVSRRRGCEQGQRWGERVPGEGEIWVALHRVYLENSVKFSAPAGRNAGPFAAVFIAVAFLFAIPSLPPSPLSALPSPSPPLAARVVVFALLSASSLPHQLEIAPQASGKNLVDFNDSFSRIQPILIASSVLKNRVDRSRTVASREKSATFVSCDRSCPRCKIRSKCEPRPLPSNHQSTTNPPPLTTIQASNRLPFKLAEMNCSPSLSALFLHLQFFHAPLQTSGSNDRHLPNSNENLDDRARVAALFTAQR